VTDADVNPPQRSGPSRARNRYAYLTRDGTLDIVVGSFVAGVAAYVYQFVGGRVLGPHAFAPIGALLTAHFLTFVIILLPIEQFVIRRLTLGARGWVVPLRAQVLAAVTAIVAAGVVWATSDAYFEGNSAFVWFVVATVVLHFFFAVGRGYLAGFRRFREYGVASGGASVLRLVMAGAIVMISPTVVGFAWAHILGPLIIFVFRPFRTPPEAPAGSRGRLADEHVAAVDERGLLTGLVLSSAASQALLLSGPLVAGWLGATAAEFSILYATLLLARAPLTFGYNLLARVLPPFTEMAARGERPELRAWARGLAIAGAFLGVVAAGLGYLFGPSIVALAFGAGFRPSAVVAALAAAGVVFAGAGLFIGQILVARGRASRLAVSWAVAMAAAAATLAVPLTDPVFRVAVGFVVGEATALLALVGVALLRDPQEGAISHGYLVMKRSMDIGIAVAALVVLSPVLAAAAVAVRLDSPGPAFFRQARTGRGGDEFWMVKLRTMVIDHDEEVFREHLRKIRESGDDEPYTIKIDDDPRITRVGARLRKWSLDELPNLWNVLRGSMSLVGPRPLVPQEAELVGLDNPRFTVKPGVTGLAQVMGRDELSIAERTAFDERYVAEASIRLDVAILFRTLVAVFRQPGKQD